MWAISLAYSMIIHPKMDTHPSMGKYSSLSHVLTHLPQYGEWDFENATIFFLVTQLITLFWSINIWLCVFHNGSLIATGAVPPKDQEPSPLKRLKRGWPFSH